VPDSAVADSFAADPPAANIPTATVLVNRPKALGSNQQMLQIVTWILSIRQEVTDRNLLPPGCGAAGPFQVKGGAGDGHGRRLPDQFACRRRNAGMSSRSSSWDDGSRSCGSTPSSRR